MDSFHQLRKSKRRRGFTFTEVLVAMGVLVLFSGTALTALSEYNRFAYLARLRAHAATLAQQKIDEVLYTPWNVGGSNVRPTVLSASPATTTESNLVMNADSFNSQTALKSNYTALATPATCTRVTTITDLSTRTLRANVTVTFVYGKKTYSVALSTIRTSDNF